ncbi:hypothetical protein [Vibrio crassostreae]|uniref:hypothetical protein n=1 Tax=Vibrio crassostreae TaxID=246167 RepID=UPI001B305CF5|nr:hypothetical protein [Vibrio crassostreae]
MAKFFFKQDLKSHFEKIEDGKPVHFKRFLLGLAEAGVAPNQVDSIFTKQNVGKKRYKVTINRERFEDYKNLKVKVLGEEYVPSQRVLAAKDGKSHSKSASGAFGLIHTKDHQLSPYCFILDEGIPRELPNLKKKLLLIENFELFLRYKEVMTFIKSNKLSKQNINLDNYDIMYTQGSMILNKQFKPFLMNYKRVDCLFDLDFGGLIIYSTLKKNFINMSMQFLVPEGIDSFMDRYGFTMGDQEVDKLIKLNKENMFCKEVKSLIKLLTTRRQKLEQEVYLLNL